MNDGSPDENAMWDMAKRLTEILDLLGEQPDREGLVDTPQRIARAWIEMTSGLWEWPAQHLQRQFTTDTDDMVVVADIPFVSLCEHHFLPFTGKCHIGYVPGPTEAEPGEAPGYRIVGLSKFARVVDGYARRPQVQEYLTNQIAAAIDTVLQPAGAIVVMRAHHSCMSLRGAKANGSITTTSSTRGLFRTNHNGIKDEFFNVLKLPNGVGQI